MSWWNEPWSWFWVVWNEALLSFLMATALPRHRPRSMMLKVRLQQLCVREARVQRDTDCANGGVQAPAARRKRTVHTVMRDDKQAHIQPTLRDNQARSRQEPGHVTK